MKNQSLAMIGGGVLAFLPFSVGPSSGQNASDTAVAPEVAVFDWAHAKNVVPDRETVIDLVTDFGRFFIPTGYLADPMVLRNDGQWSPARPQRPFIEKELSFKFTMPSGEMSDANLPWVDAFDAERRVVKGKYTAWVTRMRPSNLDQNASNRLAWMKPKYPMGQMIESRQGRWVYYDGWSQLPGDRGTVALSFNGGSKNCLGDMYVDQYPFHMEVLMPCANIQDAFKVGEKIIDFIDMWHVKDVETLLRGPPPAQPQ